MWERRIFESRETETVVMVAASMQPRRSVARPGFAVAALLASEVVFVWAWISPVDVLWWTDALSVAVSMRS